MASNASLLSPRPANAVSASVATLALAALVGCEDSDPNQGDGSVAEIHITDANNYQATATLSIPSIETAPETDLEICWDAVTSDLLCHDVDPLLDVKNVSILRFLNLSEADIEQRLTESSLAQSEVDGYLGFQPAGDTTCTSLSSLTMLGTEVDVLDEYVESTDQTYMLLIANSITPGVGALTMTFLRPSSESDVVRVDGNAGCGLLDFDADLASTDPVQVPEKGPWVLDWGDLTRDGVGSSVPFALIDHVLLGFYAGMTVSELEAQVMDLELIATSLWDIDHAGGHTAELATARHRDSGEPFAGFAQTEAGVWVLGLLCETCQSPAPILLSVLQPSDT